MNWLNSRHAIGHDPGRKRADHDTGAQMADQRGQPQPVGKVAERKGQDEADGDGRDLCGPARRRMVAEAGPQCAG